MTLTGDPQLDGMVPTAMQLVGAVREWDEDLTAKILTESDMVPLCIVLAAMVPYDKTPSELLAWCTERERYERLVGAGLDPATAATVLQQQLGREEWSSTSSTSYGNGAPEVHGAACTAAHDPTPHCSSSGN